MSPAALVSYLQVASVFFSALVVFRLYTTGLYRRYRIFFAYFVFRVPSQFAFYYQYHRSPGSYAYLILFTCVEPIVLLFYILVVLELYRLILERYKGLYTLGRWAMYAALTISVSISLLTFLAKLAPSTPEPSKRLFQEIAVERGVDLSLVLFILLIFLFLGRYPVPLSRNVIVHTVIYSLFFLSETLVLLMRTLFGWEKRDSVNLVLTCIGTVCTIGWALLLSKKGEEIQVNAPPLRPDSEERVLQQLEALNQTLLKVSRK